ncbi:OmpW family outer membrane protein [uncultured Piscinibacter sp.]|uniref:OmpW/AlkL family protein n=1 Tax=uncultured Piscinibacter sp. TaxID=1131835 RepID=UPI00262F655D|nr:OmpW family outer membrane protein [uncultured Piscinibacter sp.]
MSKTTIQAFVLSALVVVPFAAAQAQDSSIKVGVARYTTNSKSTGITGVGIPSGADAETGDATTLLFEYERWLNPNVGIELALGLPPKIDAKATGSVAFLGEVLSARNVTPTLFVNYHFGGTGDRWRPYVGLGVNYTKFTDIKNPFGWNVEMSDSVGIAGKAGIEYALSGQWGIFASVTALKVKSDLVASGSTVLTTTIDFRPVVYSIGASYRF